MKGAGACEHLYVIAKSYNPVGKEDRIKKPHFQLSKTVAVRLQGGALTPINQNAIKQEKCGNLEGNQTERDKSERDKAHIQQIRTLLKQILLKQN
jgi:hypothetical protein